VKDAHLLSTNVTAVAGQRNHGRGGSTTYAVYDIERSHAENNTQADSQLDQRSVSINKGVPVYPFPPFPHSLSPSFSLNYFPSQPTYPLPWNPGRSLGGTRPTKAFWLFILKPKSTHLAIKSLSIVTNALSYNTMNFRISGNVFSELGMLGQVFGDVGLIY